ncbi:ester cyclase [Halomarina ordinaria]|uniref:Ester cyclase n=1 Tax=Halomarina ordinaria TaxID=3033939 RepID=A0ABD5U6Z3_9EURY|nr:ester cyclase [Halomarina sp. PSRA2]
MTTTDTRSQSNAETQRRFVSEVWNGRNLDAVPEFLAPDAVVYDPTYPDPIRGPEEYAAYVRDTLAAFPDFRVDQHAVLADGDRLMTHYTLSGTNEGPLGPLPPTGRTVELDGTAVLRYADGRIVEDRAFVDTGDLRRQLGLSFPAVLVTGPRLVVRAIRGRS